MKKILVALLVVLTAGAARAEKNWVLIERTAGAWTNTIPSGVALLTWSDHAKARVHLFNKYRPPTAFPALVHIGDYSRIAYGFASVEEGQTLLAREALGGGPHIELQAQEMPYLVLSSVSNGPAIGIAATVPDGDLVSWVEHASPWDVDKASSNRLAAVAARQELRVRLRELKGSISTNVTDVQAIPLDFTSNTVKKLRAELIDCQRDTKELARIVSQLMKQGD